jgi:hypothetical protein
MAEQIAAAKGGVSGGRVVDYLHDAVVELEIWRQNARSVEERQALHRITALLNLASAELRSNGSVSDPAQQNLQLVVAAT